MTATAGSDAPTASEARPRPVARFGLTERAAHWTHAAAFFVLLGSGLVLYVPAFATTVGNRPLAKSVHLAAAVLWLVGLALVATLGDRRALRATRRELERFDADDALWLRHRPAPQGRFNAGQKIHAILQAALAVLFTVSGTLLWLGERDTTFRLPGTIALHDVCMFAALALVAGHLYLTLVHEPTHGALSGMVAGDVEEAYARRHHAKWRAEAPVPHAVRRPSARQLVVAAAIAAAGLALTVALVADVLGAG
jgi:formate dehydrogenase subunit gamma